MLWSRWSFSTPFSRSIREGTSHPKAHEWEACPYIEEDYNKEAIVGDSGDDILVEGDLQGGAL